MFSFSSLIRLERSRSWSLFQAFNVRTIAPKIYGNGEDKTESISQNLVTKDTIASGKKIMKGNFKRDNQSWSQRNDRQIPQISVDGHQHSGEKIMKGNFKRNIQLSQKESSSAYINYRDDHREILFKEDRVKYSRSRDEVKYSRSRDEVNYSRSRDEDDSFPRVTEGGREDPRLTAFNSWRQMVSKYRDSQRTPNFLTWETKEKIKMLHNSDPNLWTIDRLAANHPVSVVAVKQILKNKWTPRSVPAHDQAAMKNWNDFKEGKIVVGDENLRVHLTSFLSHKESKNLKVLSLPADAEGSSEISNELSSAKNDGVNTIHVHKEKLGQDVTPFRPPKIDEDDSYPMKIAIPKHKFQEGATYRIKDCYYHSDGTFLYRVPGMDKTN